MTTTRRGLIAGIGAAALLAGCASVKLAPAGVYKAEKNAFHITLARPWSDVTATQMPRPVGVQMLTQDGVLLNQLIVAQIQPGGELVRPTDKDTPRPTYRADMSDTEVVEFVIDSLAVRFESPQSDALRPQSFAGAPGVRFDISAHTAAGLNISGTALVARAGDNLNLLLFLAPSEHFYSTMLPEIEAILASAAA